MANIRTRELTKQTLKKLTKQLKEENTLRCQVKLTRTRDAYHQKNSLNSLVIQSRKK